MRGVTSHLTVRGRIKACEEWFNPDLKFHCKGGLILDRPKWDRYYADNEHCSQIVIVFAGDNDSCEHKTMRLKNPATILFEKVTFYLPGNSPEGGPRRLPSPTTLFCPRTTAGPECNPITQHFTHLAPS